MVVAAPDTLITTPAFIAQIADGIIANKGVKAVFVVSKISSTTIGLSARSNGQFNVMIISEELGGGGHFSAAGAQFKDYTINEVIELLKGVLNKTRGD
jgi:c-di-AMP phosphodiesterase-like protein